MSRPVFWVSLSHTQYESDYVVDSKDDEGDMTRLRMNVDF